MKKVTSNKWVQTVAYGCLLLTLGSHALAQTPSTTLPPEVQERIDEMAAQKAELEAREALRKAEINLLKEEISLRDEKLKLKFGETTATATEGEITADEQTRTLFAQTLVYKSLEDAGAEIAINVCEKASDSQKKASDSQKKASDSQKKASDSSKIIIGLTPEELAKLHAQKQSVTVKIDSLLANITTIDKVIGRLDTNSNMLIADSVNSKSNFIGGGTIAGITGVLEALPLVAGQVETITKLFRTDVTLNSVAVEKGANHLKTSVIKAGIKNNCPTFVNPYSSLSTPVNTVDDKLKLLRTKAFDLKTKWDVTYAKLEMHKAYAKVTLTDEESTPFIAAISQIQSRIDTQLTGVLDLISSYEGQLVSQSGNNLSPLYKFGLLEFVNDGDYLMKLSITDASALTTTSSSTFKSKRLMYAGTVVVEYEVFEKDGTYLTAGSIIKSSCHKAKRSEGFAVSNDGGLSGCKKL